MHLGLLYAPTARPRPLASSERWKTKEGVEKGFMTHFNLHPAKDPLEEPSAKALADR